MEAPLSATILPFRLRALRSDNEPSPGSRTPELVLFEIKPAANSAAGKTAIAALTKPERLSILPPRYRGWLRQALIASVLLHFVAFALLQIRFMSDLERAANSGGADSSDGTMVLEVEVVADASLPPSKTFSDMTTPDAKAQANDQSQPEPEVQKKAEAAPEEPDPVQFIPPPAMVEAPTFLLPQEQTARPQEAETAPAPQSPNKTESETPRKQDQSPAKQKTAEPQKKKQKTRSAPSAAAAPSRAAAARNNQGQAGARGNVQTGGQASASSYNAMVVAHLQRFRTYPAEARARGTTGISAVRFSLNANGAVISVSLARGSGAAVLDQAALAMVRRASPFPPIPPGLGRSSMSFTAPVRFNLR